MTPQALLRAGGLAVPMLRELGHVAYQWERPWLVDPAAFERAFGPYELTPLPAAVDRTVRWWTGSRDVPGPGPS